MDTNYLVVLYITLIYFSILAQTIILRTKKKANLFHINSSNKTHWCKVHVQTLMEENLYLCLLKSAYCHN